MTTAEERLAVLEARALRSEEDITRLFKFLREHMDKEEQDRAMLVASLSSIDSKLNSQRSFWAGMLFAFTGIGTMIGWVVSHIKIH